MRLIIAELIGSLSDVLRYVVTLVVVLPLMYGIFLAFTAATAKPEDPASYARSAAAARQQQELAAEGWGYSATTAAIGGEAQPGAGQPAADEGWAD